MASREVTLYRRRHCGLCDDALFELRELARELHFSIVECDIDGDADLRALYDESVPVIAVRGREIARAPIDVGALPAALVAVL
jgi:hypothetical protein